MTDILQEYDRDLQLQDYSLSLEQIPDTVEEELAEEEREQLRREIRSLLRELDAVMVAHYYTDAELQLLAEETGGHVSDSLDMARFGYESDASTLVVCGVRFMGETAKILNPEKRVLMPTLKADCSLDLGCPADEFARFCDRHPERTVVVYANTSAAVKARADWMVTSGSAVDVVNYLKQQGKPVIWAPDKYLGDYVQKKTGADMILWQGACVVHEEFKGHELELLRGRYPGVPVLVHPESPASVVAQADIVGSTSAIIRAAREMDAHTFIVATDRGIFHKMRQAAPMKTFIEAPTAGKAATCKCCAHCPWMAMNSLRQLALSLTRQSDEVTVDADIIAAARKPISRLLKFASRRRQQIYGYNDA